MHIYLNIHLIGKRQPYPKEIEWDFYVRYVANSHNHSHSYNHFLCEAMMSCALMKARPAGIVELLPYGMTNTLRQLLTSGSPIATNTEIVLKDR